MAVDKVDGVHGRASETPEKVWAARLASKLEEVRSSNSSAATHQSVTTSPSFTAAIYAQAAQYQLYNQAGVLAALNAGTSSAATSQKASEHVGTEQIHAVEAMGGATVNTLA